MNKYVTRSYNVRFLTPAFLGNAEQDGEWRTPPFKALLRQWWRVAYAADRNFTFDVGEMRRDEGMLFGNAWLSHREGGREVNDYRKSQIRIRLDAVQGSGQAIAWAQGTQRGVAPLPTDIAHSYAWFGLVKRSQGQPDRTGIKADGVEGTRTLRLAYPKAESEAIETALGLVHQFGQLGSRSRGGWGSFVLEAGMSLPLQRLMRPLVDCLRGDWPMSLASDTGGALLWESRKPQRNWSSAMHLVAGARREVRTALKLDKGPDLRAALGFAGNGRMPSPLRWKVYELEGQNLGVRVFAMPHCLPSDSGKTMQPDALERAWEIAATAMDKRADFRRHVQGHIT